MFHVRFLFAPPSPAHGNVQAWRSIDSSKVNSNDGRGSEVFGAEQHFCNALACLNHGEHVFCGVGTEVHEHRAIFEPRHLFELTLEESIDRQACTLPCAGEGGEKRNRT